MHRRDFLQAGLGASIAVIGCTPPDTIPKPVTAQTPPPVPKAEPPAPTPAKITYFAKFGIDAAMLSQTLTAALSKGGDYADVFIQHKVSRVMALEDGEVNRAYASVELGAGVRVVKGDQTGYAYTEDLTLDALTNAAKTAAAIADGPATPGPQSFRADPGPAGAFPDRYRLVRPWEEVKPAEKLPLLTSLNERTYKVDNRIKKVSLNLSDEYGAVLIADSLGRLVEDLQPMTYLGLSCVAEDKGQRQQNGYAVAGRQGFDFYNDERMGRLVREAVARTTILFEAAQPPAGEMQVVMAAGASGILLHEAMGHGMEADFNRKNISIYSDKIGKPVANSAVTIIDDGTRMGDRGAINVDDEGNVAQKTTLVEKGILATYLHDSISAKHYKLQTTGSGRRESYKFAPLPRMRSTYMANGPSKKEEIIASVKKGIYCSNFTNGQVKIGAGDFTFYVKNGYLIEDGKLTRPITDVNIIGNGPKVLEKVDMVADDLAFDEGGWNCGKDGQSVPVSLGMPTVRVAQITVGGKKA
ncbi:MAG: TldD/PmbA family protein [Polyangiaceae bacterium]|nr:TldD/PmbA family protein [Polyangiaceae bacterium]